MFNINCHFLDSATPLMEATAIAMLLNPNKPGKFSSSYLLYLLPLTMTNLSYSMRSTPSILSCILVQMTARDPSSFTQRPCKSWIKSRPTALSPSSHVPARGSTAMSLTWWGYLRCLCSTWWGYLPDSVCTMVGGELDAIPANARFKDVHSD